MYARLWWKDARMFWPIWVALVVVAAGVQWLLLHLDVDGARSGLLIVLGLDWSLLYAFAVGAAAFAGERETNTQVFLDTLPVGRRMLWTGKVSFAMVTTLVLALALAALGALGTPNLDSKHYPIGEIVRGYGSALFEGVAWSLLWSVVLASALQAAALGLLTVGLLMMLLSQDVNFWDHSLLAQTSTLRLAIAGGAFLFSWIAFTLKPLPDSSPARDAEDSPPDPSRGPVIAQRAPFGMTSSPFGRLVWQTVRESCGTWLMLAAMAFFTPGLTRYGSRPDSGLCAIFGILAALVAGVSVFGPVNRTRSYRFLAHHGVRPGVIWAARVASWGLVMSIILVAAMFAFALAVSPRGGAPIR